MTDLSLHMLVHDELVVISDAHMKDEILLPRPEPAMLHVVVTGIELQTLVATKSVKICHSRFGSHAALAEYGISRAENHLRLRRARPLPNSPKP